MANAVNPIEVTVDTEKLAADVAKAIQEQMTNFARDLRYVADILDKGDFWKHEGEYCEESLIRRLAAALEAAEQRADAAREEVGYEKRMREFVSGERDRFIDLKRAAEKRATEYAAVVEQERYWWENMRPEHAEHLMILRDASLRRLATAPADALREHDAALIDSLMEGIGSGTYTRQVGEGIEVALDQLHTAKAELREGQS